MYINKIKTILLATLVTSFAFLLIMFPHQVVKSSIYGLDIWWKVVFPSLLPFFITAELLMGLGVVHFLGILLEPLMRPIFRVPGVGAFVMAVSLISGNPMGARLTSKLRKQNLLTREEGERLVSFTSTAGPLFIFGAVSVGFFEDPSIGMILALAHYSSSILVGILMRFHEPKAMPTPALERRPGLLIFRALKAMHRARIADVKPFGKLLGEAVTSAIKTNMLIGGFIIIFSVITQLISFVGLTEMLSELFNYLFYIMSIPIDLSKPFITGIFEMTLGAKSTSTVVGIPMMYKAMVVSFLIGFNGLSIHAQIVSLLSKTDIRYAPYFIGKLIHGLLAGLITVTIYLYFRPETTSNKAQNVWNSIESALSISDYLQAVCIAIVLLWGIYKVKIAIKKRIA